MQEKSPSHKTSAFNWEDPFLLEDQLSEDERAIRDTARAYAQDKLPPRHRGLSGGEDRPGHLQRDGRAGPHRRHPTGEIWLRRRQLRLLRARCA